MKSILNKLLQHIREEFIEVSKTGKFIHSISSVRFEEYKEVSPDFKGITYAEFLAAVREDLAFYLNKYLDHAKNIHVTQDHLSLEIMQECERSVLIEDFEDKETPSLFKNCRVHLTLKLIKGNYPYHPKGDPNITALKFYNDNDYKFYEYKSSDPQYKFLFNPKLTFLSEEASTICQSYISILSNR